MKKVQSALAGLVQGVKSDADSPGDFPVLVRTVLRADGDQPDTIVIQTVHIQNVELQSEAPKKVEADCEVSAVTVIFLRENWPRYADWAVGIAQQSDLCLTTIWRDRANCP